MPNVFKNSNLMANTEGYTLYKKWMGAVSNFGNEEQKYDGMNKSNILYKELFYVKNLGYSIRQLLIPAFSIDTEDTIWFDS